MSLTWVSTEKLFPNVTPRNENSSTRAMPGIGGGGTAFLLLGLLNTISTDFALLSLRLFISLILNSIIPLCMYIQLIHNDYTIPNGWALKIVHDHGVIILTNYNSMFTTHGRI